MITGNNFDSKNKTYVATEIGRQSYEQSVIYRMNGRAGVNPKGAKGIVHEIMANDIKNVTNPGTTTMLSSNPIDKVCDAITKKGDTVIEKIQYKDTISNSGIYKTVNQMASGKYNEAVMYGTKETTTIVNQKCLEKGISQKMKSSGVSSKTTSRIGEKCLGNMPSSQNIMNVTAKSTIITGGLTAGVEVAKSVINGDSISECANHVVAKGGECMVSAAVTSAVSEVAIGVGTAVIGIATGPAAIVGTALGIGAGVLAGNVVQDAFENIGDAVEDVVDNISLGIDYVLNSFFSIF